MITSDKLLKTFDKGIKLLIKKIKKYESTN